MLSFFIYLEFTAAKVKPAMQASQHTVTCCVPPPRTESWGAEKLGPEPQTTAAPGYANGGTYTVLRNQALSLSHGAANILLWVSKPPSKIWSLILLWSLTFLQLPTSSHRHVCHHHMCHQEEGLVQEANTQGGQSSASNFRNIQLNQSLIVKRLL